MLDKVCICLYSTDNIKEESMARQKKGAKIDLRLTEEKKLALQKIADKRELSIAAIAREAITFYLSNQNRKQTAA